ncbi:MAG: PilZ domain-containing protein [Kiritimatiellae bacterium]|nr:PilZ domain-containing protein [Kiritimatiellia bacterium]MBR4253399.1 PilZ domain-containing protein [Kiritimatiellia bacterium]
MHVHRSIQYRCGDGCVSLEQSLTTGDPLSTLDDLHICHLGMKFLSPQPLPEFGLYDFDIRVGGARGTVHCSGVVVKSDPEGGAYRNVIHFVGLGEEDCRCIERFTLRCGMRCRDCGNC